MGLTKPRAAQIFDIDYKQATRVITTTNITLAGGAPSQVDGVNLNLDDRVLVIGQNTASQNGLYFVDVLGTGSNGTWLRTSDGNETGEIEAGMIVMVTEGLVFKDTQWKLTTDNPIVIGTTPLTFEQNSAFAFGNVYANGTAVLATSVGDSLTLAAGNNISIVGNNSSRTVTIGVTGISLNSISNGTSNVNVVSSGGNVTVGVGGTSNVAVFAPTGEFITGLLSVTGNITGGNIAATNHTGTDVSVTGTATAASTVGGVITGSSLSVSGNITGGNANITTQINTTSLSASGNIRTAGTVSATGSITGASVVGGVMTGSSLSVSGTVTAASTVGGAITGSSVSVTGTATAASTVGGVITGTSASISGNVTGGNILTSGLISATGNITGNNLIGNTNAFKTVSVSGESNVVATTSNQILTLAAVPGSGLAITTDAGNNTVNFDVVSTTSIFATGGDMGTVTEAVTTSEDLGNVTEAVTVSYDLGSVIDASGLVYPSQLVLPTYTSGTLPSANPAGQFIYLSTSSIGAMTAFSDGSNWRFTSSGNIVS